MAVTEELFGSYKEFHEHFMLNHNGTSLLESAAFVTPPASALLLWSVALPVIRCTFVKGCDSIVVFLSEFIILVMPLVLTYTIFADYILVVFATLLLVWALLVIRSISWNLIKKRGGSWMEVALDDNHRPFITLFRSYTNIITCLCILAVDFRVFPRRLSKTEVGGYGVMDTGTGLFVVANALVSYKPRDAKGAFSLSRAIKSTAPLLVLGSIRYFAVRLLDYQTHVSEYGSHWNFFLTLAVTRVLGSALSSVFGSGSGWSVGVQSVSLAVAHELALSALGLREWVISEDTPRKGFVSSNREGLVSLVGYLALNSAGTTISLRTWGLPRRKARDWLHLWLELTSASLFAWGATHVLHGVTGVSRRVADLGYVCWVLAYSLTVLSLFLAVELTISAQRYYGSPPAKTIDASCEDEMKRATAMERERGKAIKQDSVVPMLLQAVNHNGLPYFLLANLMTGVVNLSLQTLQVGAGLSVIILTLYMLILCAMVKILYDKEIKLKLW